MSRLNIKASMKGDIKQDSKFAVHQCFGLFDHHKLGAGDSVIVKEYRDASGQVVVHAANGFAKVVEEDEFRKAVRLYKVPK